VVSTPSSLRVGTLRKLRANFQCVVGGDIRHIVLSGYPANRRQVDRVAANDEPGGLSGNHKADIANHLAPAPIFEAPGILPSPALSGAASAATSSRVSSQPAEEFSSLRFRKHMTEAFQGKDEDVRLALAIIRPSKKIGADHFQAISS
jgi:hypothetical protein